MKTSATAMVTNNNNDGVYEKSRNEKAFLRPNQKRVKKIKDLLKTIRIEMNGQSVKMQYL